MKGGQKGCRNKERGWNGERKKDSRKGRKEDTRKIGKIWRGNKKRGMRKEKDGKEGRKAGRNKRRGLDEDRKIKKQKT